MDIKNSPEKYALTAGLNAVDMSRVAAGKDLIMNSGVDYEFRTTVVKEFHEAEDFEGIGQFIRGAERYFLQRFRDEGGNIAEGLHAPGTDELSHYAEIMKKYVKNVLIR